jgi:BirA family biotin operon repressor/biotin-[acetyl-CoA-carboxylase] ligase
MTGGGPPPPAGFSIHRFAAAGSTNDIARDLLRQGAAEIVVVHALSQSGGRGRDGRRWESPAGNLYVSLGLRPRGRPGEVALLGFAAALAVAETVDRFAGAAGPATLKWPNDVLLGGRKIAGILLESDGATSSGVEGLVIGVGLNVASAPAAARIPATCLRDAAGAEMPVEPVLDALLAAFARCHARWSAQGFAPIRAAWLARAHGLGAEIEARLPRHSIAGLFAGIDDDGALLLAQGDSTLRIHAGDVFFPGDAC